MDVLMVVDSEGLAEVCGNLGGAPSVGGGGRRGVEEELTPSLLA